jgi:hypothetical protein
MENGINTQINPESILIVTKEGVLLRLRCPFKAILVLEVANFKEGDVYSVQAVYLDNNSIMLYVICGSPYYYHYFEIIL